MIVSMLAGLGHRLRHLLRAAGLAKSTYYHLLSHPAAVTRPDIEPMVAEIFARTPTGAATGRYACASCTSSGCG